MSLKTLQATLDRWFFYPVSPYPLAAFRILFGLCVCATFLLLHADWLTWFGVHSWISMETIEKAESGFRLNLFSVIPYQDVWIERLYWILFGASVALTLGLWTRLSTVAVFLGLNALNERMPLILHAGDTLIRSIAFFLIFSPCGAVWSIDQKLRAGRTLGKRESPIMISPWAQRLIQFQVAVVYFASFWWKAKGSPWRNGTALFYVLNLREIGRFPVPQFFHQNWVLHCGTWLALAFELLFPLLVWFKPFRRPLLLAGIAFHLSLEYALNIPMFQWDMLSTYVLFTDGEVLGKIKTRLQHHLGRGQAQRVSADDVASPASECVSSEL